MRRAAKVDRNHSEIVQAFRRLGYLVADTSRLGKGFPDLLVQKGGVWLVEVKAPKGKLTKDQEAFVAQGWKVDVVRTVDDVLNNF